MVMLLLVMLLLVLVTPRSAVPTSTTAPPSPPLLTPLLPPLLPTLPLLFPAVSLLLSALRAPLPPFLLTGRALQALELAPLLRKGFELRLQRRLVSRVRRGRCGSRAAVLLLLPRRIRCGANFLAELRDVGPRDGLVWVREPRRHALLVNGELGGIEVLVIWQRADG